MKTGHRWWTIVYIGSLLFLGWRLSRAWNAAPQLALIRSTYRPSWWMASARCTKLSGAFLALCISPQQLYPIEDILMADDRGHALLANLAAYLKKGDVTPRTLVRINLLINAAGLLLVSFVFWRKGFHATAVATLVLGVYWGVPGPFICQDVIAAFLGITCLTLVPLLWLSTAADHPVNPGWWAGNLVCFFALASALLLRQPIGLIGWAGSILLLLWAVRSLRSNPRAALLKYGLSLALIFSAAGSADMLSFWRNELFHIQPSSRILSHGFSHTLFFGLGTESPNPWGIVYGDDDSGLRFARTLDPHIEMYSQDYFRALRHLYWRIFWHQPGAVARLYAHKAAAVLRLPLGTTGIPVGVPWGIGLLLLFLWKQLGLKAPPQSAWVLGLFTTVFLAQGILASPEDFYLYPAQWTALLLLIHFGDLAYESL